MDFDLEQGEIHAIIGPNGAGKTTFVSLLAGRISATIGTVEFRGENITRLPIHNIVRKGIAYTFQITSIFPTLTVLDNVTIAAQNRCHTGSDTISPNLHHTAKILQQVGITHLQHQLAGEIAYGHQRLLEIAMGLALNPRLLILDEPTQGLSDTEIKDFCTLVKRINQSTTVLLIEHNMSVVMSLAQRITVFDRGQVLAQGNPADIQKNSRVQAAYLSNNMGNDVGESAADDDVGESAADMMLEIEQLNAYYGSVQILRDLHLNLRAGEVLCLFGRNGAGKTTVLKSIMGLLQCSGSITLDGEQLLTLAPHLVPGRGIGYVPQGRRLFTELTVAENLHIGLMVRGLMTPGDRNKSAAIRKKVLALFPALAPRLHQPCATLSGGEQQMLAMARCLCLEPKVMLLDEPSEGLMPSMITTIREVVIALRNQGVAILLVEQRLETVLAVADRIAFIENGRIRDIVNVKQLNHDLLHKYVGIAQ